MKAFLKFTLVFLLGAGAAITITSFFLPPRVTALISHIGSKEAQWSEIPAWFWHAFLHPTDGPWKAITVMEPIP
ncbi:MAG: hypothetical protein NWR51_07260 [Akkermansiaceae bacterium]|jgi:hypothetical protein|nr:hypothetical protein [Akkermansiaceae bacterium]MDP4996952.1 hypothetical protein [Akkermansiaceae bacterium]